MKLTVTKIATLVVTVAIVTVSIETNGVTIPDSAQQSGSDQPASSMTAKTFVSTRPDGRFEQTGGFLHAYMKNLRPKLAFDPEMRAEDFPAWRKAVKEKLIELLCFPPDSEQPPAKKIWSESREGYQLEKWEVYPEPYSVVPFLLLIPHGASEQSPAPGVLCFPGSTSSKESLAGEPELVTGKPATNTHWASNRQALFYVQDGFISVAVENPATNETGSSLRNRSDLCDASLWMGRNYLGISVFQKACILKWLAQHPLVDSNRIATSGHSLGSTPADILGILYPDLIKAVIHNDFVCNWQERKIAMNLSPSGIWHTVPELFLWFDHTDLQASLAPTPLLFTEGGRANQISKIRQSYKLMIAEDKLDIFYYKKYETPDLRLYEDKPLPEGLTGEEYFKYANVDPSMHRFHGDRAVPWLAEQFGFISGAYPRQASSEFPEKFEMNQAAGEVDPAGDTAEWERKTVAPFSAELTNGLLEIDTSNSGSAKCYWESITWPYLTSQNVGFTMEFKVRVDASVVSSSPNAVFYNFCGNGRAAGALIIGVNNTSWNTTANVIDSRDNSDKMHVFRMAYEGESTSGFKVWRDGELIGSLLPSYAPYNRLYFGESSGKTGGSGAYDYVRFTRGCFAPDLISDGTLIQIQ